MTISIERLAKEGVNFTVHVVSKDIPTHSTMSACDQQKVRDILADAANKIEALLS